MSEADPWAEDYYDRLGVSPDADGDEIQRQALKAKARFDPARSSDDADRAKEAWFRLQDAIETLTDDAERAAYDRTRRREDGTDSEPDPDPGPGPDPDDGPDPDPDPEPEPDPVSLHLEADVTRVDVGESVTFTVTDGGGDHVREATVSATGAGSDTTGRRGRATLSFDSPGTVTVEASKSGADATYEPDSVSVTVEEPDPVRLSVSAGTKRVTVGEPVEFTVVDGDGDPVRGATVAGGGERDTTGSRGTATLTFYDAGSVTVEANRSGGGRDYVGDDTTVTVTKRVVSLRLEADRTTVPVGDPVVFTVSGDGREAGVTVEGGGDAATTGSDGTCELAFDSPGTVEVTACKDDTDAATYEPDAVEVEVEAGETELLLQPAFWEVGVGESLEFTVRDSHGSRMAAATVEGGGERDTTGPRGTCELTFDEPGSVEVTACKDDADGTSFVDDVVAVDVVRHEVPLMLEAPDRAVIGEAVEFTVRDDGGSRIEGATVEGGGKVATTGPGGTCELTFDESGTGTVEASKSADEAVYVADAAELEVEDGGGLALTTEGRNTKDADETFTAIVTDAETGEPVGRAAVEVVEEELTVREYTESDGRCEIEIDDAYGAFTLRASAERDGETVRSNAHQIMVRRPLGAEEDVGDVGRPFPVRVVSNAGGLVSGTVGSNAGPVLLQQGSVLLLVVSFVAVLEFGTAGFAIVGLALALTVLAVLNNSGSRGGV